MSVYSHTDKSGVSILETSDHAALGRLTNQRLHSTAKEANAGRQHDAPGYKLEVASHFQSELQTNPKLAIDFIIAPPRMAYYMEYSTRIYEVYLKYVAPEDIVVYSIDEVFMDVTDYLNTYKLTAHDLAMKIILDVIETTGITATAGIGTNLFLCKVAMDIVAKHIPADKNGVRIAELDEMPIDKQCGHISLSRTSGAWDGANHIIFNAVNFVDYHSYRSNKRTYRELRQLSDAICKEHGLSVIPPSQNKGMDYKEYTEAKRGTSWKQKLRQTIDRLVITANDWDEFLKLMQEAGYEIKPGKYISFRAEGQERFTRAKTIGENYSEERLKERIAGRNPRKQQMQTGKKYVSLISDIQERIKLIDSKGYEHKAKITILKEAARTLNYLTENNLLEYADLERKVEDVHSSYAQTGTKLKRVEARLREIQPLIKNISNYQNGVVS